MAGEEPLVLFSGALWQHAVEQENEETLEKVENAEEILKYDFGVLEGKYAEQPSQAKHDQHCCGVASTLVRRKLCVDPDLAS